MTPDNDGAAAVAEAHPSDSVPVDVVEAPPLVVAKEQPADGDPEPAPAPEPTASDTPADPAPKPGKPPKLPDWAQKRFDDLAAEKRIADREAKRLADELAALKTPRPDATPTPAPAATPTAADTAAVTAAAPQGGYRSEVDFNAAVQAEAARRSARDAFDKKSNDAFNAGKTTFGDEFPNAVDNLHKVGLLPYRDDAGNVYNNDILEMVLATDDPSKVLYELGSNPDKASQIVTMTPAARAIEIAKLAVGSVAPKATPVQLSNAPRPVTPVDGSARTSSEPSDADSDEEFFRKREAQLAAKRAANG